MIIGVVLEGVLIGSIYTVLALGLWLLWSLGRVVNLAHGELALCGAYAAWWLDAEYGWDPLAALLLVIPASILAGALLYRVVLIHLFHRPLLASVIVTLGVSVSLQVTLRGLFTTMPHAPTASGTPLAVAGGAVTAGQVLAGIIAALVIAGWVGASHRTRTGRGLLAVAQNPSAANLIGVDIPRAAALAVVLAIGMAATAGVLLGQFQWIQPSVGPALTVKVIAIATLSTLGSVRAILVAAIGFATLEATLFALVPLSATRFAMLLGAGLVVAVLAVRPATERLRVATEPGR